MRLGLAVILLGASPAGAECTLFDTPTIEGVAIQAVRCAAGAIPMDVTYEIRVQSGQTFSVALANKTVVVSTGPATCNGKPVAPVETDAHSPLDKILQVAARCVTQPNLDLDHPLVHVQLGHWNQTGPTQSTLVRETRITVDFEPIARRQISSSKARIAVDISLPVWSCAVVP